MSNNNITAQGCVYLQEALKDSYSIEEIVREIKKKIIWKEKFSFRIFQKIQFEQQESKYYHYYSPMMKQESRLLKNWIYHVTKFIKIPQIFGSFSACALIDSDGLILQKIIQVFLIQFRYSISNWIFKGGDMLEELYLSGNQLGSITCKNIGSILSE